MIYIFIFVLLLYLSYTYDVHGRKEGRNQWYNFLLVFLILLAGLRYRLGTDTQSYIHHFYHDIPVLSRLTNEELGIGAKPLWNLLNSIVKTLGLRYYIVQLIEATFVNVLVFRYIKKHSRYIFTCLLFYYLCLYTGLNFEIMKAAMSIVITLYANDYFFQKKWLKAYVLYIIAFLFHPQAIVIMILIPLSMIVRFNWICAFGLFLVFVVGSYMQSIFGDYFMLLEIDESIDDKLEHLSNSENHLGQLHSLAFMLKTIFIYLIYACICLWYQIRIKNEKLLVFVPFIVFYIGFLLLEINVYISYRFVLYYTIYFILFMSETFVGLSKQIKLKTTKNKMYLRAFVVVLPFILIVGQHKVSKYFLYYPYSSVIERSVDVYREQRGMDTRGVYWHMPNKNEY